MAKIHPFKALRPVRDKAHLVATRPYYSYKKGVLKAKLQSNPYTFLRIINPEFGLPKEERGNKTQTERFEMVKAKYAEFIEDGILIQEQEPHFYLYRQMVNGHAFTGIVAGSSVSEYLSDNIKKHEATITAREQMFVEYLNVVEYNAEPVLLCHPSNTVLTDLYDQITQKRPEYEFTTTDCITHEVWILEAAQMTIVEQCFSQMDSTYIADGHHRSASSVGLHNLRKVEGSNFPNDAYFLSFLIDESSIKIFEYNRLVRLKSDKTLTGVIQSLTDTFALTPIAEIRNPNGEHEIIMVTEDQCYAIQIPTESIDQEHPVNSLDAEILTQRILSPILDISDLKTDANINFFPGVEALEKLHKKMKKGNYQIAFLLYPPSIAQVKKVADAGMIMPPKSTWVEPKMRSGLTIYHLNE